MILLSKSSRNAPNIWVGLFEPHDMLNTPQINMQDNLDIVPSLWFWGVLSIFRGANSHTPIFVFFLVGWDLSPGP